MSTIEIIWMAFATIMAIGASVFALMWREAERELKWASLRKDYLEEKVEILNKFCREKNNYVAQTYCNKKR